jgi:UMF1 family MFS transporter
MTRRERSWVLYDVANSAFIMFATTVAPIFYGSLKGGEGIVVDWGYTETVASIILALLMPFFGSLADFKGNKMKFFIGSVGTGVVACAALCAPTGAFGFLVVYAVAAIGVNSSIVFYDAFLVDVTSENRYDSISTKGYAWGYVGSLVPFLTSMALIILGPQFGLDTAIATRIGFVITAAWWLVFSIPFIRNVKQTNYKPKVRHAVLSTFKGLAGTVKAIAHDKKLLMFMIAFFCYIDGVHTIIKMATSYGTDLGIDANQLIAALVVTQLVAFPSALLYGRLARRFGGRIMLVASTFAYALITLYAAFLMRTALDFWVLAICVGLFQGGIQALSRSYFGRLIPKSQANEYYGFFDVFGKYAAILGTALMSGFTHLTGSPSLGILSITLLFVLGAVFLILMPRSADLKREGANSA